MNSLKLMFEGVDDDVIQLVLESHQGRIDGAVTALLAMSGDSGNKPRENAAALGFEALPDDFLRPPSYFKRTSGSADAQNLADDEAFARIIQEEMDQASRAAYENARLWKFGGKDYRSKYQQSLYAPTYVAAVEQENVAQIQQQPALEEENVEIRKKSSASVLSSMGVAARKRFDMFKEKINRHRERRKRNYKSDGMRLMDEDEDDLSYTEIHGHQDTKAKQSGRYHPQVELPPPEDSEYESESKENDLRERRY